MGINLADIITLAKAGYTPAQVKELITLSEKEPDAKPEEQQAATAPTSEAATESAEPEKATENAEQHSEPEQKEIDYKALYEKTQEDLKKAQAVNRSTDLSDKEASADPYKDLQDYVRSIL